MKRNKSLRMMMMVVYAGLLALAPAANAEVMFLQCEDYRAGANALTNGAGAGVDSDYTVYSHYDWNASGGPDYADRHADGGTIGFGFAGIADGGMGNQRAVGYTAAGEWFYMSGAVGTPWNTNPTFSETSYYSVVARVATANNDKSFKLYVGGTEVVTIDVPNTGGTASANYQTVTAVLTGSQISAGEQTVKFYTETGGFNIDWISFEAVPYSMTLQCEDYRDGSNAYYNVAGEGEDTDYTVYSYYDTTTNALGVEYAGRNAAGDEVDFGFAGIADGGMAKERALAFVSPNEWFYMSGNIDSPWNTNPTFSETSYYSVVARVATANNDKSFKLYVGGTEVVTIDVPNTGGTASSFYQTVTAVITGSQIAAGEQTVKFYTETGGFNIDWVSFEAVSEVPGYEGWAISYSLVEPETGDDDNDGLSNIYEYGLGGDPTNALDQGTSPVFGIENEGGTNTFGYIHPQLADPESGLTYSLALCTDLVLGSWVTNAGYVITGTNVTGGELDFATNITDTVDSSKFIHLIIE